MPKCVDHYTSAAGLNGIIESNEIWLSNVAFVNDNTECLALKWEDQLFDTNGITNKDVKDAWEAYIDEKTDSEKVTYIASFTDSDESLEQWRAYGNFRIRFETTNLKDISPFNFYRCVYDRDSIKQWILEKSNSNEWGGSSLKEQDKRLAASQLIYAASRKYKNKYFKEEKEVRIVTVSYHTCGVYTNSPLMYKKDRPIHFRDHSTFNLPVPYVKLFIPDKKKAAQNKKPELATGTYRQMKERKREEERTTPRAFLPIKEVLIGPMMHQHEAQIAYEILLKDKGHEDVKVEISNIPYRGF